MSHIWTNGITAVLAVTMATLWVLTGHWIYLDGRKLICLATFVAVCPSGFAFSVVYVRSCVSEWFCFLCSLRS